MVKRWLWVLAVGMLGLTACSTTVHGLTPAYPKAGLNWAERPRTLENLQPTFRWKPVAGPDVRYDFIIYESHKIPYSWAWVEEWVIGKGVYYREELKEPKHTLEVPLQPNRAYYWSVRVRRGENLSDWSRFDYRKYQYGGGHKREFPFFIFKTPDK